MAASRFEGARVLVTGGSRGIGRAIAQAFVAEGARVAVGGRTKASATVTAKEIGAIPAPGDVTTVAGCDATVGAAVQGLGGLDILVNNAGVFIREPIAQQSEASWDLIMAANVKSVQFCTRAAIPALQAARGNIVNIASESGLNGYPGSSAYCASKGAVVNLTRSMAMELAPDIRVNALCPGVVETDMSRAGFAVDGDEDEGMRQQQTAYPLGRIGTVEECAAAVLFMASAEAGFINGAALPLEGGATVGKW
ncbi:MAG: SDR family NAD(P)-dependent oxidoreductase [Paracoccaceae bacterium]